MVTNFDSFAFFTGTTWMQEIVFLIHSDMDVATSDKIPIHQRYRFIEMHDPPNESAISVYQSNPPPQLIKSHLGTKFFEKTLKNGKTKFIIVFRNPKDMLVSYYHFYKLGNFSPVGNWDDFFELFKSKTLCHGDIFDVQLSWWNLRDNPNILILNYEDMLKSPEGAVRQVATHMGKDISDDLVAKIVERTSFKSMKNNPSLNYATMTKKEGGGAFMRKGVAGDWKNHFSEEQAKYVDELSDKLFKPVGIHVED